MKKILLVVLLLTSVLAWAQKTTPGLTDYTISVHVLSSHLIDKCWGSPSTCISAQHLTVSIQGKKYELAARGSEVLRVGDYKAKIAQDETKRAYEYQRTYEFLFTDGTASQYRVVGEGEQTGLEWRIRLSRYASRESSRHCLDATAALRKSRDDSRLSRLDSLRHGAAYEPTTPASGLLAVA